MEEKKVLQDVSDALTDKPVLFDIDIQPRNNLHKWAQRIGWKPKKRYFTMKGLTPFQVYKISGLLLSLDAGDLSSTAILKLFQHMPAVGRILAIALTPSREEPPEELIWFLLRNLNDAELQRLVALVLDKMKTTSFLISTLSLRNLQMLESGPKRAEIIAAHQTPGSTLDLS